MQLANPNGCWTPDGIEVGMEDMIGEFTKLLRPDTVEIADTDVVEFWKKEFCTTVENVGFLKLFNDELKPLEKFCVSASFLKSCPVPGGGGTKFSSLVSKLFLALWLVTQGRRGGRGGATAVRKKK